MAKWTNEELEYLKNSYLTRSYAQMAVRLKRTGTAVCAKLGRMGLAKPQDDRPGRFHKKHGRTASQDIGKVSETVNGQRKFLRVKTELGWVPYHRHVWETAHGPIPKGAQITFKDGNALNCALSNLRLQLKKSGK